MKSESITMAMTVQEIVMIEGQAYSYEFQQMQDCEDWEDIADYCEVNLDKLIVIGEAGHWYGLIALDKWGTAEFVDIAKIPGSPKIPKLKILKKLRDSGIKQVRSDLRECTSYKVLKLMPLFLLGIKIKKDKRYYDEEFGEWMHEMKLKI